MKINKKIFAKLAVGAFFVLFGAKLLLASMSSFLIICIITGIAVSAIYYSFCDSEGNIRKN
jgi:CHASE3 domain sensor protein